MLVLLSGEEFASKSLRLRTKNLPKYIQALAKADIDKANDNIAYQKATKDNTTTKSNSASAIIKAAAIGAAAGVAALSGSNSTKPQQGSSEDDIRDYMENVNIPDEMKDNVVSDMLESKWKVPALSDGRSSNHTSELSSWSENKLHGSDYNGLTTQQQVSLENAIKFGGISEQVGMTTAQRDTTETRAMSVADKMREKGIDFDEYKLIMKATGSKVDADNAILNAPVNILRAMIESENRKIQETKAQEAAAEEAAALSKELTDGIIPDSVEDFVKLNLEDLKNKAGDAINNLGSSEDEIRDVMENVNIPEEWKENVIEEMLDTGYNINDIKSPSNIINNRENETEEKSEVEVSFKNLPKNEGIIKVNRLTDTKSYSVGHLDLISALAKKIGTSSTGNMNQEVTVHYDELYYNFASKPTIRINEISVKITADSLFLNARGIRVSYITVYKMMVNDSEYTNLIRNSNMNGNMPYSIISLKFNDFKISPGGSLSVAIPFAVGLSTETDRDIGAIEATNNRIGGNGTVVYNKTF